MSAKLPHILKDSLSSSQIIATPHIGKIEVTPFVIEALLKGGINWIEITLRTPIALDIIRLITKKFPEMNVMAGTVIERNQVVKVQDAGASIAVSPNLSMQILEEASSKSMPFVPGVATPSEIGIGIEFGLDTFKFFPAEMIGGMRYLKRVNAPYAHKKIKFIPLGGLSEKLITEYISEDFVLAIGGSWITNKELLIENNWQQITQNAINARAKVVQ